LKRFDSKIRFRCKRPICRSLAPSLHALCQLMAFLSFLTHFSSIMLALSLSIFTFCTSNILALSLSIFTFCTSNILALSLIGIGDGGRGHLPHKIWEKYFQATAKFWHFVNFMGKYHVQFGHSVNFSVNYHTKFGHLNKFFVHKFSGKNVLPLKVD